MSTLSAVLCDQTVPVAASSAHLSVRALRLSAFRSYERLDLALDGRPVTLTGANGAGKTNVLEALSLLAPGRGLRGAALSEVRRRPAAGDTENETNASGGWAVAASVRRGEKERRIGTGLTGGERRQVRIDGETASGSGALAEIVRIAWLTPVMDRLFLEGAGGRRRFLDRLVLGLDPAHAGRATAYEKAMRERTRLLKDGVSDDRWLGALEAAMAEHGLAVAGARTAYVERLCATIDGAHEDSGAFPRALVALEDGFDMGAGVEGFAHMLARMRRRDGAAGRALIGAHKADLAVMHEPKGMEAASCSTGEQKALLIGLVLAHAALLKETDGAAPLLLLDEIAAHLDADRRAALFDRLCALGAQAWMTGTDESLFEALGTRAQHFRVGEGRIVPVG